MYLHQHLKFTIMKKNILLYTILISACFACSAQNNDNKETPKSEISIELEKEILTSLEASLGTMNMVKVGDYLILHDSHVSDRKIACINYISGTETWSIETGVDRFFVYKDELVLDFDTYTAGYDVATGDQIWKIENVCLSYLIPNGAEVNRNLLVHHNGQEALFNIETKEIKTFERGKVVEAYYFTSNEGNVKKYCIGTENKYKYIGAFLGVAIVDFPNSKRIDYVWTLDEENREFHLLAYDENNIEVSSHTWKMDEGERLPEDFFNGNPEPEKLSSSIEFVGDKLFFFENYVNYRWSWNRGTNRITCVDPASGELEYQLWGQKPGDSEYYSFVFFNNTILYTNNTMHFQDGDGKFYKFDLHKGKVLDSLPQQATLFRQFDNNKLLGFSYDRDYIEESEYTNAVEMKLWNIENNTFSKSFRFEYNQDYPHYPFVFGKDGLVVIYFYLEDIDKSMLHCYKLKEEEE